MSRSKQEDLRVRIGLFIQRHSDWKKCQIVRHFVDEGKDKSTIYKIIKRLESGVGPKRRPGSGRYAPVSRKVKEKVVEFAVNTVGISYAKIGRKFGLTQPTIKKILLEYDVHRMKRKKCPKVSPKQAIVQKKRILKLRKLLKPSDNSIIVMDDEKYLTIDGSEEPSNDFFYMSPLLEVPEEIFYRPFEKFPKKVMVWLAISEKGLSEPFIIPSGNAVSGQRYVTQCLPLLQDFIDKYHSDGNYWFWPDLASSHYAKSTQKVMQSIGIKFVPKHSNPPNVPQLRPIERYWAYLQRRVFADGWTAENIPQLKNRIRFIIRTTPLTVIQNLMRGLKTKIRKAADQGVLSLI